MQKCATPMMQVIAEQIEGQASAASCCTLVLQSFGSKFGFKGANFVVKLLL